MKFSRKLKKFYTFKRFSSSHQSAGAFHGVERHCKLSSHRDLSITKKKSRFSFIKKWTKKKRCNVEPKPSLVACRPAPPRIEELEYEFMNMLKAMHSGWKDRQQSIIDERLNWNNTSQYNKRLLITRSTDDYARASTRWYLRATLSSHTTTPRHQPLLKTVARLSSYSDILLKNTAKKNQHDDSSTLSNRLLSISNNNSENLRSESCLKKPNSNTNRKVSLHWDENSLKSTSKHSQQGESAIIEVENLSISSNFNRPLKKSHSFPLPINTNRSSVSNDLIQSALNITQCHYENNNQSGLSLSTCISEMKNIEPQSSSTSSSDDERAFEEAKQRRRHRWSLQDIWTSTMAKLPPILNHIWRQRLYRTGSREFLLEYDQTLQMNNNNNRTNLSREERYIEQERPIDSHIGIALLAFILFPPIGIVAIVLSIWSLCGEQDRHLSRKFGRASYWISIVSICISFLLLSTLLGYFTYQHLINQPIIVNLIVPRRQTHRYDSRSLANKIDFF